MPDALTFLSGIEDIIHAQVIKLYPDAQLPKFDCLREGNQLTMIYHSDRHLADLAEGLIMGCGQHFGDNLTIQRDEVNELSTRFIVTKV